MNPRCNCGVEAVLRTTKKPGANLGRKFFACSTKGCDFFQWVDEIQDTPQQPPQPSVPTMILNTLVVLKKDLVEINRKLNLLLEDEKPSPRKAQEPGIPIVEGEPVEDMPF